MSVSKWAYEPDKCDGESCVGDCDLCDKKWENGKETNNDRKNNLEKRIEI